MDRVGQVRNVRGPWLCELGGKQDRILQEQLGVRSDDRGCVKQQPAVEGNAAAADEPVRTLDGAAASSGTLIGLRSQAGAGAFMDVSGVQKAVHEGSSR